MLQFLLSMYAFERVLHPANTPLPIFSIDSGNVTLSNDVQLWKAYICISVNPSLKLIDETLEQLLKESDVVSMHCPLVMKAVPGRPATYHLMGEEQFKMMKDSAYFINTSRGQTVDEAALVKALKEGWIRGAGIDVIEDEATEKSELFGMENAVVTPHAAFVSVEAFEEARVIALRQLVELLHEGKVPENLVNKAVADKLFK